MPDSTRVEDTAVTNPHWIMPDYYGGGIANLMSSIANGLGGKDTGYPGLACSGGLDAITDARNIILLVVDGLGYRYLSNQNETVLAAHCRERLTTVFPSTTATAIPMFLTGVPPQQHGFTGWFTYFSELGSVIAVLPFCHRLGYSPVDSGLLSPGELSGATTFFDRIPVASSILTPDWISDSAFNRAFSGSGKVVPFHGLQDLGTRLCRAVGRGKRRQYLYAYWGEFDALAHQYGVGSTQVAKHFRELDRFFEELLTGLRGTDTLLLVTADHGFIDSSQARNISLADHPKLADTLMVPLCGEPRLAFCYVHPDKQGIFEDYVGERFSQQIDLVSSSRLLEAGWYGLGAPHPGLKNRIGHYTLVMRENYMITGRLPGERPNCHIGVHGGVSQDEMYVPLIVAEC